MPLWNAQHGAFASKACTLKPTTGVPVRRSLTWPLMKKPVASPASRPDMSAVTTRAAPPAKNLLVFHHPPRERPPGGGEHNNLDLPAARGLRDSPAPFEVVRAL